MNDVIQPPSAQPDDGVYVEVLGPDGLVHHVGPFKSREHAAAWIAQNSSDQNQAQVRPANAFAFTNFGNLKPRLTE